MKPPESSLSKGSAIVLTEIKMPLPRIGFVRRFMALYGLVFIFVFAAAGFFISHHFKQSMMAQLQESLVHQSLMIREIIRGELPMQPALLQSKISALAEGLEIRITYIDPNGLVLADSKEKLAHSIQTMDNHASRPEIAAAMRGDTGISTRYSMSLGKQMLYVAVPILEGDNLLGVVRVAMPSSRIQNVLNHAKRPVSVIVLIAVIIILLSGSLFANHWAKRLRTITRGAVRYARQNWSEKILVEGRDELRILGDAMNRMAGALSSRIADLESEKGKISTILSHMSDGVIAINRKKEVVMANPMAEKLFGFSTDAIRGKSLIETTRHPYLEIIVDQAFTQETVVTGEIQLIGNEKKILRASVVATTKEIRDISGILVFHDITELRRLEQIRKEFVANASHELRTPLTSLKGFIETLRDGAEKDPKTRKHFLTMMHEDATRLGHLVEDILTLGEIEQRILPLKKETLDLASEIRESLARFEPQLKAKKLTVNDHLTTTPFFIQGDRDKIRQVFVNLLDNAVKYTPEGGSIFLSAEEKSGKVKVTIRDTGPGIPEDTIPRIFERFFRVDKARSRELGGTGLGLAIAKHIMESHDGSIDCQSVLGKGSSFSVSFPL